MEIQKLKNAIFKWENMSLKGTKTKFKYNISWNPLTSFNLNELNINKFFHGIIDTKLLFAFVLNHLHDDISR